MIKYFEQFRDWENAVMISENHGVDLASLLNDCIILQLEKIDDEEEKEKAEILNNPSICQKLTAEQIKSEQDLNKNAKFLHKVNKQSYMESELDLAQRLDRNKHYRGKYDYKGVTT